MIIIADSPRPHKRILQKGEWRDGGGGRGAAQTALRAVSAAFGRSGGSAAGGCAPISAPFAHPPGGPASGVSILMHGRRVATNGDIRFEQTPGQWQPFPKQNERILSEENNTIVTRLSYPDHSQHLCGSNPLIYPDLDLNYQVTVRGEGDHIVVAVDLDRPVPPEFAGKLCFNLELFPGDLFGKPWLMDGQPGIFPTQPNGPVKQQPANYAHSQSRPMPECGMSREMLTDHAAGYQPSIADDLIAEPYAVGHCLVVRPDDDLSRLTIES